MKAGVLAARLPRLEYGHRFLSDFLPERVLSESRLVPLRTPEGAPEIPDLEAALVRALEASSTPDLLPSLAEWLRARGRGGGVTTGLRRSPPPAGPPPAP